MLVSRPRFTSVVTRVGTWLGLAATALTLFYAPRRINSVAPMPSSARPSPTRSSSVRPGDRITQFAHWTVRSMRDIQSRLFDLAPGTEVQVKVDGGEASLDLRLVVEGHPYE